MEKNTLERGAGVLCHISSLPNKYGIGSLGKEAYEFCDFLVKAKVRYWQILPLVQTGFGDSPYQSVCCFSGNPYFIDLEALASEGLLTAAELEGEYAEGGAIDYGALYVKRYAALRRAYLRFDTKNADFIKFVNEGGFLDYALFMAIKGRYNCSLKDFPQDLKFRKKEALDAFFADNAIECNFWLFVQYEFFKQWKKLKKYANRNGIKLIGDIPLYVAADSSDVWAHPELFRLDEDLNPVKVAGVPPDYFSRTGQLWGNPLYDWEKMAKDGYGWWIERMQSALNLYDVVRIDHFRGLDRYYAIPAGEPTAENGEWVQGPAIELFERAQKVIGKFNLIAEDLGVIDDGVIALREGTGFPGMKILMFAFDGNKDNDYLPQNITENSVTYTGTHDNDTAYGFILNMTEEVYAGFLKNLRAALKYEGLRYPITDRKDAAKALCLCALGTKSRLSILPIQDILCLDNSARMNTPSTASGNWQFRLAQLPDKSEAVRIKSQIVRTNRE